MAVSAPVQKTPVQPVGIRGHRLCLAAVATWLLAGPLLSADQIRYFADGPQCLAARVEMIREARRSIDVAMFIWRADENGFGMAALLRDATRRGVRVRVIFDAVANELPPPVIAALEESPLFEARVYHTPNVRELSRLNRRMHDKIVIADHRQVILGGRNFAYDYFRPPGPRAYLDLDVLAEGTAAQAATRYFETLWASSQVDNPEWHLPPTPARSRRLGGNSTTGARPGSRQGHRMIDNGLGGFLDNLAAAPLPPAIPVPAAAIRFVHDRIPKQPGQSTCWAALAAQLQAARREVWLVTPWIVTTPDNLQLLQGCLDRGAKVHIITNSLSACRDYLVFSAHAESCRQLAARGCTVHLMPGPASLHSKALVVDQRVAVVGSQNYDPRSEFWNTECMLVVRDATAARELLATIRRQAADAYLLDPARPNLLGPDPVSAAVRRKHALLPLMRLFDPLLRPVL